MAGGSSGAAVGGRSPSLELDPESRAAYLDEACRDDPALRREVEGLLSADAEAGSFMRPESVADRNREDGDDFTGRSVGAYRLTRLLGRGGMGEVYLGERADDAFRKQVAVKLIRPGMVSRESVRRFHTERRVIRHRSARELSV